MAITSKERSGRWIERHEYRLRGVTPASAEAVYDTLADLASHLEWSGARLPESAERLLTLEAPPGPAREGTEFTSSGYTPIGTFHDRSRVTVAERPARFAFVTESLLILKDGTPVASTWIHRFEIEPETSGSRVTRIDRQAGFYAPAPWWLRIFAWPPIAVLGYRLMARTIAERTHTNLLRMAEERAVLTSAGGAAATARSATKGG